MTKLKTAIYKFVAVIYRYHKNRDEDVAYFSLLTNLVAIMVLYYYSIISLFHLDNMIPDTDSGSKIINMLTVLPFLIPMYLIAWKLFPKKKMMEEENRLTKKEYRYGKILFFLYFYGTAFMMILIMRYARN